MAYRLLAYVGSYKRSDAQAEPSVIIEKELLAYLVRNPDAEDSMEGIRRWWLSAGDQYSNLQLQSALDELVARKLMVARQCPEGHIYYRANLDRRHRKP